LYKDYFFKMRGWQQPSLPNLETEEPTFPGDGFSLFNTFAHFYNIWRVA